MSSLPVRTLKEILETFPDLKIHHLGEWKSFDDAKLEEQHFTKLDQNSVSGVTHDSRLVASNFIFVLVPEFLPNNNRVSKGHEYLSQAISNGASCIILNDEFLTNDKRLEQDSEGPIYLATSTNLARLLSALSKFFYPSQPKWCVGVTGTNGKTSTVTFTRQLLGHLQKRVASLGTLGLQVENISGFDPAAFPPINNTTLYAPIFHELIHKLAEEHEIEFVIFEASSHGLKEFRAHGVQVQIGVFTNLTHDHLDYHGTMDDYFQSKCKLFEDLLLGDGTGVVFLSNKLEQRYMRIIRKICTEKNAQLWIYGQNEGDLFFKIDQGGDTHFNLWGAEYPSVNLKTFMAFQMENMLVSLGIVSALLNLYPTDLTELISALPNFMQSVPGRMEFVAESQVGSKIFVDYAHTPNALEIILESARKELQTSAQLIVVFGCGGNRDTAKREPMGQLAAQLASIVIVTDDNPRFEDPSIIRQQILKGCRQQAGNAVEIYEISDRRAAIRQGMQCLANKSDILIIAGKGAETYQIVGNAYHDFSDKEVVRDILVELKLETENNYEI